MLLALALAPTITFRSLLAEMGDRDALARLPSYECHQASSYNRESVSRDKPGWFADSDGTGFIRKENHDGKPEWVMMEHDGPGCITKMWTPFFYYDFNNRVGPNIRIYLDGAKEPVIDESYIKLVTGKGSIPPSLAWFTARAGDSYLPIPFAKSAKVTMTAPPFYHLINYRTYPKGTSVESFQPSMLTKESAAIASTFESLKRSPTTEPLQNREVAPAKSWSFSAKGPAAIQSLKFSIPEIVKDPTLLRTLILKIKFDGEEAVWCPLGDFFHSANALHPIETWTRTTDSDGTFTASWTMPYAKSVRVELFNGSTKTISVSAGVKVKPWKWDFRSMHFHARWRPDDIVPGSPFQDWNFIDISGQGVYVGDAWTVLNIRKDSWWGEGDEKIYVDDAWDKGFPTHFGTGSEDYYGWAGGVYPDKNDDFSNPFLANKVGLLDGHTQGYNVLTRIRSLDAIPFQHRLRFDMEASFGVDMREKWNLLGYSVVTFYYARPGAKDNRPPMPDAAFRGIMTMEELQRRSDEIRRGG